jgi:hypothetical protein
VSGARSRARRRLRMRPPRQHAPALEL